MKAQIQLPANELIDYWDFCKAIAQAICPAGEQDLNGIDCIEGKLVTHHVAKAASKCGDEKWPITAALQSVLLSDDGRMLDQLRLEDQPDAAESSTPFLPLSCDLQHQVVELTLPYKLTNDDRQLMEKLLADLPALHYPMSEDDVATFMDAYFNLPNRPAWEPVLVSATTIERRKVEQDTVRHHHQKALQGELTHGRLAAVNANHVLVAKLAIGNFLPRDQAIVYLDRCGISHRDKAMGRPFDAETQVSEIHQEPLDEKQRAVGQPKLSGKEKKKAIIALHEELIGKGVNNFTKQVAEQFDVSDSYIRGVVREAKPKDPLVQWNKKRK